MKKKYKLKTSAIIIIISIILILIIALLYFVFSLFKTKSYSLEYNLDDYNISEYYDNTNELFYYEIKHENVVYNFIYKSKYIKERKLINKIDEYKEGEETCITINSNYIESYPLCNINGELIDYNLVSSSLLEQMNITKEEQTLNEKQYDNYIIYDQDIDIYIWNYKGFNHIKNGKMNFISLFNQDVYEIPLTIQINDYIVIPDYEQNYTYNKVYIIDTKTEKINEWTLKSNISFDSYILGIKDKSVFIIDQKNKKEYELVPHKQKMRILATSNKQGIVYYNGEEKKISMKKLVAEPTKFTFKSIYNYKIIDNGLYLSYLDKGKYIKISDNANSIISIKNDTVYYLVDTILYKYTPSLGNIKEASYSEWAFNNSNVIFING